MSARVEFALFVDDKKHETRKVSLKSPVKLLRQPDMSWVVLLSSPEDMQSADIIRKMGKEFCITPLDDAANVTLIFNETRVERLQTGRAKRLLSDRAAMLISIPK